MDVPFNPNFTPFWGWDLQHLAINYFGVLTMIPGHSQQNITSYCMRRLIIPTTNDFTVTDAPSRLRQKITLESTKTSMITWETSLVSIVAGPLLDTRWGFPFTQDSRLYCLSCFTLKTSLLADKGLFRLYSLWFQVIFPIDLTYQECLTIWKATVRPKVSPIYLVFHIHFPT